MKRGDARRHSPRAKAFSHRIGDCIGGSSRLRLSECDRLLRRIVQSIERHSRCLPEYPGNGVESLRRVAQCADDNYQDRKIARIPVRSPVSEPTRELQELPFASEKPAYGLRPMKT